MQAEKPKHKRRWSIRILEGLIVIAAIVLTVQLLIPQPVQLIPVAEPVVAIPPVTTASDETAMTAKELYTEALELKSDGKYEEALGLINLAVEFAEDPDIDYYWQQAWLLGETKQHEAALDVYLDLLRDANNAERAYIYTGLCYNYGSLSDFAIATQYCESAGEFSTYTQFSSNSMCYIHGFTGQYETAIEECNSWIADTNHPYAYNNRSHAYLMLGDYEQTIRDATRAIELGTDRPEMPYTNRGLAKIALGQYEAGYADLMVAYGADNTYPDIYLGIAQYHDHMGNRSEARENYCRYLDMAWVTPEDAILERINELGSCRG